MNEQVDKWMNNPLPRLSQQGLPEQNGTRGDLGHMYVPALEVGRLSSGATWLGSCEDPLTEPAGGGEGGSKLSGLFSQGH